MFELSVFDSQFDQCVCEPKELKKILQHQKQQQKLNKSKSLFKAGVVKGHFDNTNQYIVFTKPFF